MKSKRVKNLLLWKSRKDALLSASKNTFYVNLVAGLVEVHVGLSERKRFEGAFRARQGATLLGFASELESSAFSTSGFDFARAQIASLIKKYPFDKTFQGLDPEGAAKQTFFLAEEECKAANLAFLRHRRGWDPQAGLREKARRWIRYIIGDKPKMDRIYGKCGFGPGASIGVHGDATSFVRKLFAEKWTSTHGALPYFLACIKRDPLFWELLIGADRSVSDFEELKRVVLERVEIVDHNKVTFVPKTAKTHRAIAVEPILNSWVQKGVEAEMKTLLKRAGIDLTDQSRNQELARQGSLPDQDDPYCTIDLSHASDSISIELVRDLLPPDWFSLLNRLRSPAYRFDEDSSSSRYEKFSSMGNGFTFPLESLIFGAIAHACGATSRDFAVYGDDIIVRKSIFEDVISLLKDFGFTPNSKKTFSSGLFRESCGADWYAGRNVRPVTLDYELDSVQNLIKFSNITRRSEETSIFFVDVRKEILAVLDSENCPFVRPYQGPDDTALEVDDDVFLTSKHSSFHKDTMSWSWTELLTRAIRDRYSEESAGYPVALLMAALRGASSEKPFAFRRKTRTTCRKVSTGGAQSTWVPLTA